MAKVSSDSSSAKLKQKKLMFAKKKIMGPTKKRVLCRTPMKLTNTKTSPLKSEYKKILQGAIENTRKQTIDNTRISQQAKRYGQVEINSPAMNRAKKVQSKLPSEYPSFVKYMLKSHVSGGFWLGLSKSFCKKHLPKKDETLLLVCERVEEHRVKYLVEKNGLSGGWRGFSLLHKLVEGDVLIFQLIESLKFKVYIMRVSERAEIDGAMGHLNSNTHAKPLDNIGAISEDEVEDDKNAVEMITTDKCLKPHETGNRQKDGTVNGLDSEDVPTIQQRTICTESIRMANSVLEFKDVKGFESFNIIVDGLIIDTEIPFHVRYRYYELCRNQKSFLHDDLVKCLNCKLVSGIISEIVKIADAIKATTRLSLEHLQSWDKTLKAFEDMGMRVGFLRTCINKLVCLIHEQQEIIGPKKLEQAQLEEEIKDLERNLLKRREVKRTLDDEIAALSFEITFKNIANADY